MNAKTAMALGLGCALTAWSLLGSGPVGAAQATTAQATAATSAAGAAAASSAAPGYRSQYHFSVPDHWKNDPQRPIFLDGAFHYYYLYNADYGTKVGTAWRHATTTDNVSFADQGVAAPKETNANYDLWSGSAVIDTHNTAGFGAGTVIMLVTQMDHPTPQQITDASGPQAQFLWYSTDGGRNFRPYGESPVIPNGGRRDARDPKVVWDAARDRWVAAIAEGDRISFSTSPDLKNWTRVSEFVNDQLGTLECPDLFQLRADDGTLHWVLGLSANGYRTGDPNTYAYWTGDFDGTRFTPDKTAPQWLDQGFDWYGAVSWEDPAAPLERRFAMGWMNNWTYAHTTPSWPTDGFNGTDSIVRTINLKRYSDGYALASRPVDTLADHATATRDLGDLTVNGVLPLDYQGDAYQLEADVSWQTATNIGAQLRVSADGTRHADAGVTTGPGAYSYLNRGQTGNPGPMGGKYETRGAFDPAKKKVRLRILVDRTSVELFVDDGRQTHTQLVFADPADKGLKLYASDGPATFANVRITEFAGLDQRPATVLADFEGGSYGSGWSATGDFTGTAPVTWDAPGRVGTAYADTFVPGRDSATGTLTSPAFTIDRRALHLLIGGGRHPLGQPGATSVNLLVDGQPVRTATGFDSGELRPVRWNLDDLQGRRAQLQILDDASGDWGHLMVDQVVLSD
ncbi:glycoside hydrolase family 32 protein [Streptomyces polyrhachis]|uniref:Glycoside hydrolase family 32 protein n=1 Tax=Streptomyces polyrhachis TaxID=1282885 RepID=A0ABW2GCY6_9ACTN